MLLVNCPSLSRNTQKGHVSKEARKAAASPVKSPYCSQGGWGTGRYITNNSMMLVLWCRRAAKDACYWHVQRSPCAQHLQVDWSPLKEGWLQTCGRLPCLLLLSAPMQLLASWGLPCLPIIISYKIRWKHWKLVLLQNDRVVIFLGGCKKMHKWPYDIPISTILHWKFHV